MCTAMCLHDLLHSSEFEQSAAGNCLAMIICPYSKGNLTQHHLIYFYHRGSTLTGATVSSPSLQTPIRERWGAKLAVLRPDVPRALRKLKAVQSPKQNVSYTF